MRRPRHFCFHPSGELAVLINELGSVVTPLRVDKSSGALSLAGASVSTLPDDWAAATAARQATTAMVTERENLISHCAHVAMHPNGRFAFGSNRGHDSIATFAVDHAAGTLTRTAITATGGETPRNFQIDATGRLLLVGNQDSDSIVAFAIDGASGALRPTGMTYQAPSPVALCFV